MIKTIAVITLITFILLFILQGKYIIKLKQHLRFKHKSLYENLNFHKQPALYGPLLGMGRTQINSIRNYNEENSDSIINDLALKIKNYSISANIGVVLSIALVVVDAFIK